MVAIVGALNWGFVGLFEFNPVHAIFGSNKWLERALYGVVGLSAIWLARSAFKASAGMVSEKSRPSRPRYAWRLMRESAPMD
jgi:hypothetical protein